MSLKVIGTDMDQSAAYDRRRRPIATMGLSRTVFRDTRRFQSNIFPPRVFYVPDEGVPLGIWCRHKNE